VIAPRSENTPEAEASGVFSRRTGTIEFVDHQLILGLVDLTDWSDAGAASYRFKPHLRNLDHPKCHGVVFHGLGRIPQ
jgi:hypothetical protein